MTNMITKTAAAAFVAAFAMTGAAFADDATLNDKLNAQMQASQAQIAHTVNTSAQTRVSKLVAQQDNADEESRAKRFEVASK